MYQRETKKLPPKRPPVSDFNNLGTPPNDLNLLIPYLGSKSRLTASQLSNCPSLNPIPIRSTPQRRTG